MAEVLGVVASGIAVAQLATALGGGVVKLKKLWAEVRDVPQSISTLMTEIELIGDVLTEVEASFGSSDPALPSPWDAGVGRKALDCCRQAALELDILIKDLSRQISESKMIRRGKGRIVAVLEKSKIAECEDRLQKMVRLLGIAQQCQLVAMMRAQPALIVQQVSTAIDARTVSDAEMPSKEKDEDEGRTNQLSLSQHQRNSSSESHRVPRGKKPSLIWSTNTLFTVSLKKRTTPGSETDLPAFDYTTRVQLPPWLSGWAWDIQLSRSVSGWTSSLKSWRTIPEGSQVFKYALEGDIDGIRTLLSRNEASLYDRDDEGWTLLHFAALRKRGKLVRQLCDWGLDLEATHLLNIPSWTPFALCILMDRVDDAAPLLSLSDYLSTCGAYDDIRCGIADELDVDKDTDETHTMFELALASGCFQTLQPKVFPNYYKTTLGKRFRYLSNPSGWGLPNCVFDATAIQLSLREDATLQGDDVRTLEDEGHPVLQIFSRYYCRSGQIELWSHGRYRPAADDVGAQKWQEWRALLREFASLSRELSGIIQERPLERTEPALPALLRLILGEGSSRVMFETNWSFLKKQKRVLRSWLEDVQQGGIDLGAYGRRHAAFLLKKRENLWAVYQNRLRESFYLRLAGITYGPTVDDWKLIWDAEVEAFAGDFWIFIDNPPLRMPGQWVDDERYDDWHGSPDLNEGDIVFRPRT